MNELLKNIKPLDGGLDEIVNYFKKLEPYEALNQIETATDYIDNLKRVEAILGLVRKNIISEIVKEGLLKESITDDKLLSIPEVAEKLRCTRQTVYNKHIPAGLNVLHPTGKSGNKKVRFSDLQSYISGLGS